MAFFFLYIWIYFKQFFYKILIEINLEKIPTKSLSIGGNFTI